MPQKADQLPVLDCSGCGVCCLHMGYPAFNLPVETLRKVMNGATVEITGLGPAAVADLERWRQMPDPLRKDILKAIQEYQPPAAGELDQACIWLDPTTRLCSHHTHRPQVCRDFEIGCDQCLDWRRSYHDLIQTDG